MNWELVLSLFVIRIFVIRKVRFVQSLPQLPAFAALEGIASLSRSQARGIVRNDNPENRIKQPAHTTGCTNNDSRITNIRIHA